MCQYSLENGYTTLLNVATPGGMAQDNEEIMVDDGDKVRLLELRKKYKNIIRNIWNPFDKGYANILGCNTVNRLYVTPIGDVLVCPYVHVKIGNVYDQSLKDISEYGFGIKYFHDHSDLCLAGEDHEFVHKCMQHKGQTIFNPIDAKDFFVKEDYVNTH
jgi:MoaA/NifB/PqqE/SkfB family radical SAM enzyme